MGGPFIHMGSEIPKADKNWIFSESSQMPVQELTCWTSADMEYPQRQPLKFIYLSTGYVLQQ